MAFEKAKVIKAAEKFLSQGKINAAIKEYRQIIKHDDDDLTAVNMLGDLLARAGHKDEAISCFLRIAEHYREQEFRLKAIAMYKKIEKLKPRDPDIANKLGELYAAQGLVVDSRAQFLIVADAYTRAGETKQTLKVLHKIADLAKPDLVQRDQSVTLIYESTGLFLTIRGKALEGGTEGDVVSVMNLQSKRTVSGVVTGRGQVSVSVSISTPRLLPAANDTTSSLAPAASSLAPVAVATNATSPVSPKAE